MLNILEAVCSFSQVENSTYMATLGNRPAPVDVHGNNACGYLIETPPFELHISTS